MSCVIAVLLFAASQTDASLWYPASGSTYQSWDFATNANPAAPEVSQNPFGTASVILAPTSNGTSLVWDNGVWSSTEFSANFTVPNQPVANELKEMVVQIRYRGGDFYLSWAIDSGGNQFTLTSRDVVTENGWNTVTDKYQIRPNPNTEYLCYGFSGVTAPAALDWVTIDTRCIPEPATMALLGLGMLLGRKRK